MMAANKTASRGKASVAQSAMAMNQSSNLPSRPSHFHRFPLLVAAMISNLNAQPLDPIAAGFRNPPASARPWVYWFWNNGNVTEEGIDADLASMKQAGIGGVIHMDVLERHAPPAGDADYMGEHWQKLMARAISKARELGIEINLTNGPGWCGSSGPWITPELSMQALVSSTTEANGGVEVVLAKPALPELPRDEFSSKLAREPYYQDIAVLAWPKRDGAVSLAEVLDLTKQTDEGGRLKTPLPAGEWIVRRIGHASTGSSTRPPVKGGNGLEADKFSKEAITLHYQKVIGKFAKEFPMSRNGGLVATHVDSWEVGSQNWTRGFSEEFRKRRGYDLTKYLPLVAGNDPALVIGSKDETARFRWDFSMTCSELLSENYIGALVELSHRNGLRFTLEGYNLPFGDEAEYTAPADEPMTEFWSTGGNENARKAHEMASVGHTTGRKVIGAEAFTASDADRWSLHPALIKPMGDYQFAQGVNRFVIHRYAMQPYLDRFPGATMGPWGLHYERTNTWWPMTGAWHQYLSRCQYLLREGHFVADALFLRHQQPDQTYFDAKPELPPGYRSDDISARQLIARAMVKDGRIVLPDGMSYRMLIVPDSPMTPDLLAKLRDLAADGATIYGPQPKRSPSLSGHPECDKEVERIATEVWGGGNAEEHAFGKGKVIQGTPLKEVLDNLAEGPDFQSTQEIHWIHRRLADREVYFVANPKEHPVVADMEFRIKGMVPQWWDPETGGMQRLARYESTPRGTRVKLPLSRGQSGFVVFQAEAAPRESIVSVIRDGKPVGDTIPMPAIDVVSARYGPPGDPARTIDAKTLLDVIIKKGSLSFDVASLAQPVDPAFGLVKKLSMSLTVDGRPVDWSGVDSDRLNLLELADLSEPPASIRGTESPDGFVLRSKEGGTFQVKSASGKQAVCKLPAAAKIPVSGPWLVSFPKNWGAPEEIRMEKLASLSESEIEGVRHFSGISIYQTSFRHDASSQTGGSRRYWLELGRLEVMAEVNLNGETVGTVWNRPARIEITKALKPGRNELSVRVANCWRNRMIGDSGLPEEKRFTWSSYQPFKPETPLPASGLIGPVFIQEEIEMPLTLE